MSNVRPFQVALIAVFGVLGLVAIIFLTTYQAKKSTEETAYGNSIEIWGTLPQEVIKIALQEVTKTDKAFNVVEYRQFDKKSFDSELVNAIAEGRSPDLIILQSSSIVKLRPKLFAIPYETMTQRDFKDAYVDGAEIFGLAEGFYGIPFAVDPMIMYWNRDLFASNGLAQAPTTWEQVVGDVVPKLIVHDTRRNVLQSGVSFGEYRNVAHPKEMLMVLALQSGSKLVTQSETTYKVELDDAIGDQSRPPFESTVQFYTDFSNVNSPLYSWNRAMPQDTNAFLAGDLGLYFGPGSEYRDLQNKNPNLNFDVAQMPQGVGATALRTYGEFYAFSIPKAAKNPQASYAVANVMSRAVQAQSIAQGINMAPVLRGSIAQGDSNFYRQIILNSALISRSWLDPSSSESDTIFMQMIEDIVSNRARVSEAVGDAIDRLTLIF